MEGWVYDRFFKVSPLFKGVDYYLGFPLPAPNFQGAHYSRVCTIHGNTVYITTFPKEGRNKKENWRN